MSRAVLLEKFGPPESKSRIKKTSDLIWGPIESFWGDVPDGSEVETWSYKSTPPADQSEPGSTQLYFIDGSETVQGIGFAVEGAVY